MDTFKPGAYWTPERAEHAARRMLDVLASPAMQAMMDEASAASGDPAATVAAVFAVQKADGHSGPVSAARIRFRRGEARDVPRLVQLIALANLPPLFIEEFLPGFAVAEHDGEIVGCGGLELYGDCGVIRSVVTDERARGLGLGRRISELLIADAQAFGVSDVYLFTQDAWAFWKHLGFIDVPLDRWKQPPRSSWQYQFIAQHPEFAGEIHTMWRGA